MFKKLEEIFSLAEGADYEKELFKIVENIQEKDYEGLMSQIALKYASYDKSEREETLEEKKEKKIMGMIAATKPYGHYLHSVDYFGCGCTGVSLFRLLKEKTGKHSFYRAKECAAHCSLDDYGFEESESCIWGEGGRAGDRLAFNSKNFHGRGYSAGEDAFRESKDAVANIDEIGEKACYEAERIILQAEEIKSFYQPKSGIILYTEGNMIGPYDATRKNVFLTTKYQPGDEKRGIYSIPPETFRGLNVTNMSARKVARLLTSCNVRIPTWLDQKIAEEKAAKEKASAEKK